MPHVEKNSVINDGLSQMQHGHLHDALGVWRSMVSDVGHLPRTQDLSPFDFMRQLGRVSVISVEKHTEQVRFRWRLQGTAVHLGTASLHGEWAKDWTGRCIDEVPMPEYKVDASNGMLASVRLGKPVHVTFSGVFDSDYEMN